MISRMVIRGVVAMAAGFALIGCDRTSEPPPQRGCLQIEIESPSKDGGSVKVKVNKPPSDEPKDEGGAKVPAKPIRGGLYAVVC